jgi:hypothetical protein
MDLTTHVTNCHFLNPVGRALLLEPKANAAQKGTRWMTVDDEIAHDDLLI